DCDDGNAAKYTNAPDDQCDLIDNDCDGEVDEDATDPATYPRWYVDSDGDGFANFELSYVSECTTTKEGHILADASVDLPDCDDEDGDAYPGSTERLNDVDDDCNGTVDDGWPIRMDLGETTTVTTPLTNFVDAPGTDRSSSCGGSFSRDDFLVGVGVSDDRYDVTFVRFIDNIVAICSDAANPSGEPPTFETTNDRESDGDSTGGGGYYRLVCPEGTFVTGAMANFNSLDEIENFGFECSSVTGSLGETAVVVGPPSATLDYPIGSAPSTQSVSCPPGDLAVGLEVKRTDDTQGGASFYPHTWIALECATPTAVLIEP
ncbi:MAG: putative metal-binding motif-containing protein, partial [Polyangiaceae bacterium]|nr:putative metal-binding motif-containing protein [Polyangiaceae bacterium]